MKSFLGIVHALPALCALSLALSLAAGCACLAPDSLNPSGAPQRTGLVARGDQSFTLLGAGLRVGDKAPDFEALRTNMTPAHLSDWKGKTVILASVPSLDTPVCNLETLRFNQEASRLGPDVAILTLSMDLPFAQKRWCGATGADKVVTLSDHRQASFGLACGLLIKETRLLARAVIVVAPDGVIRYIQIVPQLGQEPDYAAALEAAKKAAGEKPPAEK